MRFTHSTPCADCPFLPQHQGIYGQERLEQFAAAGFPCHKTAPLIGGAYRPTRDSSFCAGALIWNHRQPEGPNQVLRIGLALGLYDPAALDLTALEP